MTLVEYSKLPGVVDLPMKVRGPFAQALQAEDKGDSEKAEHKLLRAISIEEKL